MRVVVTGGAGYIGSHTVLALLEAGHDVVVVDDLSTGHKINLPDGVKFVPGRFQDDSVIQAALSESPDALFHFAALKAAGESMEEPEKYAAANIRGSLGLIERCAASGVRNFVFSSSAAVYGEPQYLPIDENHPTVPINYYGFTKKSVEENLSWFSRLRGMRFAALRYFNAAGYDRSGRIRGIERRTQNLLPLVMEVAAGIRPQISVFGTDYDTRDGTCIRDYVHVEDLASAHVLALEYTARERKDVIVNLGSELGMTVFEMIRIAEEVSGKKIKFETAARRAGDPPSLVASSTLGKKLLGWSARYSDARTIIESMWNLYRDLK